MCYIRPWNVRWTLCPLQCLKQNLHGLVFKSPQKNWDISKQYIFLMEDPVRKLIQISSDNSSGCSVLSCLFRRMTCFWVLWPCNPDGCIHINKRISEALMSLEMENQWLFHAEWKIFSFICGQLTSILINHINISWAKTNKLWHFSISWETHLLPLKLFKPLRLEAECF